MTDPTHLSTSRPAVSAAASWLGAIVALGALTSFCCIGLGTFSLRTALTRQSDVVRDRVDELRARAERVRAAEALLDEIVQHLEATHAFERGYPRALPEAPPPDPWGEDLRYERAGLDRAWLSSAGPDRRFGTDDDLVRTLTGR